MRRGAVVRVGGPGPLTGLVSGAFRLGLVVLRWAVVGTAVVVALWVAGLVWVVRKGVQAAADRSRRRAYRSWDRY